MKNHSTVFDPLDVRNDEIGIVNKLVNWVFTGEKPNLIRRFMSLFLHIELPALQHPLRMPHPFGITVNPGVQIGRNVTIFQCVTVGSKRYGRNAGVPVIGDDVVIYPNAVVVGGGGHRCRGNHRARSRSDRRYTGRCNCGRQPRTDCFALT